MKLLKKQIQYTTVKDAVKNHKGLLILYLVIRLIVIGVLIESIILQNYESAFLCILTLVLLLIPSFIEKKLHIAIPNALEVVVILFIFSAEILGEIDRFYIIFDDWDTMLHTINGFMMAAIGFSLVDIFNRNEKTKFSLSPVYLAFAAFCFSMTIGVLWEFLEFSVDMLVNMDMQKDTMINKVNSVLINPSSENMPVHINDITKTIIHTTDGKSYTLSGYLDIGLLDTIEDLFVNFIGAFVFSVIGFFYVKSKGKNKFASQFIPQLDNKEDNSKN